MVLLKSLQSPTSLIKEDIEFQKGINVILGRSSDSEASRKDKNGIGKSYLIRLIDFALLSSDSKNYFDPNKNEVFKGHSIILEFEIDGKNYFIKREFDNPNEPYFGESLDDLEKYEATTDLKNILESKFFGRDKYYPTYDENWFRSLIKFYVKDDIDKKNRRNPTSFVHHSKSDLDHYKYNLFLFGIRNEALVSYKGYKDKKSRLQRKRNTLEGNLQDETGKTPNEIETEVREIEERIETLEEAIEDKNFTDSYEEIEDKISELKKRISELVRERSRLRKNLNEIEESYEYDIEVNPDEIEDIYSEIDNQFADQVRKELEEVIEMRKTLSDNRKKFLQEKEERLKNDIEDLNQKISELEEEKSRLYKVLEEEEEGAFDSIKNQYENLVEEKQQKERLKSKIDQINEIEKEITELNKLITQKISEIREEVEEDEEKVSDIYSIYSDIVKNSTSISDSSEVIFNVKPKSAQDSPLDITVDMPQSDAYAKNELRMLAFDLSVFFHTIQESRKTPRFLAHDGLTNGMGANTIVRILNYVNSFNLQNPDFQYIITGNEDELIIPMQSDDIDEEYQFDIEEKTIIELGDSPQEMLFQEEF